MEKVVKLSDHSHARLSAAGFFEIMSIRSSVVDDLPRNTEKSCDAFHSGDLHQDGLLVEDSEVQYRQRNPKEIESHFHAMTCLHANL